MGFSPDGTRLATGSRDGRVKIWEGKTGFLKGFYRGHPGGVWSVAFSPDGKTLVSGGCDGAIRLWGRVGKE